MNLITITLLIVIAVLAFIIGRYVGQKISAKQLEQERAQAIKQSRAVLGGQFSENLAPYLPDFPYSPTECRFVGKPVDFIVFKGMDQKHIHEVTFVEVKSGKANLNLQERNLKKAIQEKKVNYEEYRIPEDITSKRETKEE